tara:strand:- start:419 stop:883 length:465 start_codon:yes stop_codon:yes gene_type:complete
MVLTLSGSCYSPSPSPASLQVCCDRPTLESLFAGFNEYFDEDGNDFLYPIQEQRNARQMIGGGRIEYALLVLIRSQINFHAHTIFNQASSVICSLHNQEDGYDVYSWQTEVAIANQIIKNFPNVETIEDFINDDELLRNNIHTAAEQYGAVYAG